MKKSLSASALRLLHALSSLTAIITLATCAGNALAVGHIASVDIYDRTEQRNLPIYWHHGRAYVVGAPGNEYRISVRNTNGLDVLAVVSVDGVNVLSGETAAIQQGGYVIDSWQQMDIAGWRKSLARTAAFYFTPLTDSYAARTGRPGNVGVIGAALYRRKTDPVYYAPPAAMADSLPHGSAARERSDAEAMAASPAHEKPAAGSADGNGNRTQSGNTAQPSEKLGTGHGRSENSPARYTSFERATEQPEEVISIYYDSYANLVAMGVIPSPPHTYPRREPQPFPGRFVPDPH